MQARYTIPATFVFFGLGIYFSVLSPHFSDEGNLKTLLTSTRTNSSSVSRDPAAIRRTYDFSGLDGSALAKAQKMRLLSGAKVVREKTGVGVELGHFVIKGEDGQKTFACQKYGKIAMTFVGDGSAVNGELPKMEVEGLCEMSADINSISPLWIPVAKILGEPVADGEFSFKEGKPISLRFANVLEKWPTTWQLQSVRLFTSESQIEKGAEKQEVIIPPQELRQYVPGPLLIEWK